MAGSLAKVDVQVASVRYSSASTTTRANWSTSATSGPASATARWLELGSRLKPLQRKTSPFTDEVPRLHARDAVWVTPSLVGEVSYSEFTRDLRLRHPSWRGLRPDKSPAEVHREP